MTVKFIRTCQECGNRQVAKEPSIFDSGKLSDAYRNRKCKKCKSEALDFGSDQDVDGKLKRLPGPDEEPYNV